jgi:hypothetical protein
MHRFFSERCGISLVSDMLSFQMVILELLRDYMWENGVRELAIMAQNKA